MKNIEEIREKLGPDYRVEEKDGVITVCDIWDGVEFAIADCNGIIYKIDRFETSPMKKIWFSHGRFLFPEKCKPSTESAYVEQLKAKAKELYGEIKAGDRFDLTDIGGMSYVGIQLIGCPTFVYIKRKDELFLNGYRLYSEGKWAKKIEERVKVEPTHRSWDNNGNVSYDLSFSFKVTGTIVGENNEIISKHLAKCLEEYLNKS